MKDTIISKAYDLVADIIIKFLVYFLKIISPVKISPKVVNNKEPVNGFKEILNLKVENRLSSNLYNIFIAGISKKAFDIKIISDDGPKGKTVEHMNINTNHIVFVATDKRNGNHLWIFRIHKFGPKEVLNLNIKIENIETVYFKTLEHSRIEVPITERDDGVVGIPFKLPSKVEKVLRL